MAMSIQLNRNAFSPEIRGELRASHAGEVGAVWIYRGILAMTTDKQLKAFAREHMAVEKQHLAGFESIIHLFRGSIFLPAWMLLGALTGALPALLGRRWVYYTIATVEAFVVQHYQQQIDKLAEDQACPATLVNMMIACQADEDAHREDACSRLALSGSTGMWLWGKVVSFGSAAAVALAKRM